MQENEVKVVEPQVTKSPDPTEHTHLPSPGRHERKCNICNHSDRAAIEFDFINWRNPAELVKSFQLRDLSTIYRHAHATGLFARRRLNLRGLMERIAERVSEVPITAAAIIRAARAIAHINDAGEWIDPPTRIIVEHVYAGAPSQNGKRGQAPCPEGTRMGQPVRRNGTVKVKKVSPAIFTSENLDEPSLEAASCGERPRIDPKSKSPYPTEIVLEIDPVLYEAGQARRRRAEAACLAQDAKEVADPVADHVEDPVEDPERSRGERSRREPSPNLRSGPKVTVAPWKTIPAGAYDPFSRATRMAQPVADATDPSSNKQNAVVSSTLLPQAAVPNSAPSNSHEQNVAASSSWLAPARLGEEVAGTNSAPSAHPTMPCKGTAELVPSSPAVAGGAEGAVPLNTVGISSLLPQAASNTPATACPVEDPEQGRGEQSRGAKQSPTFVARAGSAGSTDPPFPFDPSPNLWRKGRKRWHK